MNSHAYNLTSNALATTLANALRPVTVEAICRKADKGWHTLAVLESVFGIASDTEINTAIRTLARLVEREKSKALSGHWSYSENRLIAILQHKASLEKALKAREAA